MSAHFNDRSAFIRSVLFGTVLQLGMVVAGHWIEPVADLFGILGVAISFAAGWLFARWAPDVDRRRAAVGGAIVGGLCAAIGIAVSLSLGDVPAVILAVGTASSTVTGLLGGVIGAVLPAPLTRSRGAAPG